MAQRPEHGFTHTVVRDADYYREKPREGDQPDDVFSAGTQLRLLNEKQGYAHVRSEGRVTGWVSKDYLEPIFRPTHGTTQDSPYWLKANGPPTRPSDGTLPAKTGVLVHGVDDAATGGSNRWAHVQWAKDGDIAFIDIVKTPLKPL
jgi:hypothetical protein